MEFYLKLAALVVMTVILCLMLNAQHKVYGTLASMAALSMVCAGLVRYLWPVVELLDRLKNLAGISSQMLSIVLKTAGVGLIGEMACLVCTDGGNTSMGKAVQMLSNGVILWISLPLFEQLLELLQEVLGRT